MNSLTIEPFVFKVHKPPRGETNGLTRVCVCWLIFKGAHGIYAQLGPNKVNETANVAEAPRGAICLNIGLETVGLHNYLQQRITFNSLIIN